MGTIPTGFDGNNRAKYRFSKPVETITVVLTGPAHKGLHLRHPSLLSFGRLSNSQNTRRNDIEEFI